MVVIQHQSLSAKEKSGTQDIIEHLNYRIKLFTTLSILTTSTNGRLSWPVSDVNDFLSFQQIQNLCTWVPKVLVPQGK